MESNKRQRLLKVPVNYHKGVFNLCMTILNYYKNKELNEKLNNYKYYRFEDYDFEYWEKSKRECEMIYLCHKRKACVKSKLSETDAGVVLSILRILWSNTDSQRYMSYEYNYENYKELHKIDGLELTKEDFERGNYNDKYNNADNYNPKYMNLFIKNIKNINKYSSNIVISDYLEEINEGFIEMDKICDYEYICKANEKKPKGYSIEDIINLFEFVD